MDEKKILIVNLSKGLVGENNANLLGSMIVTKIYLAAMSRADVSPRELKKLSNFYLYVDEFQSFANKSFADILSEARKYKLSLNITHQYIEQMADEVRAAVFGNVGTMIAFRVGSFDAEVLEKEFAPVFTMEDIVNLGLYQIYLKLMIDGVASQPFSAVGLPPFPKPEVSFRDKVMEMSRKNYASPKIEVEKTIREWHESEATSSKQQIVRAEKKVEPKYEQPKPKISPQTPRSNSLAEIIKKATEVKTENKIPEQKKEIISLQELRYGEKNKNKEQSPENRSALKEALKKLESEKAQDASENKTEKKEEIKKEEKIKEVPEETLRKILKGE
jgi:hypothetical protein